LRKQLIKFFLKGIVVFINITRQVSIKKIAPFTKIGCRPFLIIFILLFTAATACGEDSLTETKIPDEISV